MIRRKKKQHLETVWCPYCGRPAKADLETGEIWCPVCGRIKVAG